MKSLVTGFLRSVLTWGEYVALRRLVTEFSIARYHRQGLRKIKAKGWMRPNKINLGCGSCVKEGYLNVDMFPGADLTLDLRLGLPFESNVSEQIMSEHFYEHVDYPDEAMTVAWDCFRILKPGGNLRFSVPDTEWPVRDYSQGIGASYFQAMKDNPHWHPPYCTTPMEHINSHFRQHGEHLFAYDFETLKKVLAEVGFIDITRLEFDPKMDSEHRRIGSLIVSAKKPA
jgi:predicted SAM-dependent methyltransferase